MDRMAANIAAMAARAEAAEARASARAAAREAAVEARLERTAGKMRLQPEEPAPDSGAGDISADSVMVDICREAYKNVQAEKGAQKVVEMVSEPGVFSRAGTNAAFARPRRMAPLYPQMPRTSDPRRVTYVPIPSQVAAPRRHCQALHRCHRVATGAGPPIARCPRSRRTFRAASRIWTRQSCPFRACARRRRRRTRRWSHWHQAGGSGVQRRSPLSTRDGARPTALLTASSSMWYGQ